MWSTGYNSLKKVNKVINNIVRLEEIDEDKLITIAYYLHAMGMDFNGYDYAKKVISKNKNNLKLLALYIPF